MGMSSSGIEWCRRLGIRLGPNARVAIRYLESHGRRFCVEFGYQNATRKMAEHQRAVLEKQKRPF
jgi:hypothetical protein